MSDKTNPTVQLRHASNLRKGEYIRKNGSFAYRWVDEQGKRRTIYAKTLDELRSQEKNIARDQLDSIRTEGRFHTLNDIFRQWEHLKRGLKDNTFQNYRYLYHMYVEASLGKKKLASIVKSDIKRFYNALVDERGLSITTVDSIHTVLHQVLDMAVDDGYIRINPARQVMKELKLTRGNVEKRRALSLKEQTLFLDYLKRTPQYRHWYPIFAVLLGTGMRVGEAVGLRWCDIDLDNGVIDVNHTLVYYRHAENGCYCNIHTPKTVNSIRQIPMLAHVKAAFLEERQNQQDTNMSCTAMIDGYTDFIFVNRFGQPQHQGTLNKALRRIIRDCNDEALSHGQSPDTVLLPRFSCHILRHTFTTRLCEAGVNIKVIQDILGHADVSTTLNIYATATREFKQSELSQFDRYVQQMESP